MALFYFFDLFQQPEVDLFLVFQDGLKDMVHFHYQTAAQRVDDRGQEKNPARFLQVQVALLDLGADQVTGVGLDLQLDFIDFSQYFFAFHFAPFDFSQMERYCQMRFISKGKVKF
jgi:hypothetical protein